MFTEFVLASEIWLTAKNYIDKGYVSGLVRGYNVEVIKRETNEKFWMSCEYIHGEPNEELLDEFHRYYYSDLGVEPTGRICFRGYGMEQYDWEERDTYIIGVEV